MIPCADHDEHVRYAQIMTHAHQRWDLVVGILFAEAAASTDASIFDTGQNESATKTASTLTAT